MDARGSGLTAGQLRVLNNRGTVYLTAYQPFAKRRLLVRLLRTGQAFLMDVQSDAKGQATALQVLLPTRPLHKKPRKQQTIRTQHRALNSVLLMRAAIHARYPEVRVNLHSLPRLEKQPITTPLPLTSVAQRLFPAKPAQHLKLTALTAWRTKQAPYHFITALSLQANGLHLVTLSLASLRGRFKAASSYPVITLNNTPASSSRTTLFLLSDQPFEEAMTQQAMTIGVAHAS